MLHILVYVQCAVNMLVALYLGEGNGGLHRVHEDIVFGSVSPKTVRESFSAHFQSKFNIKYNTYEHRVCHLRCERLFVKTTLIK